MAEGIQFDDGALTEEDLHLAEIRERLLAKLRPLFDECVQIENHSNATSSEHDFPTANRDFTWMI